MKKTFVFLSAVALMGIGLIWSCSDDENDYTANNRSGQSTQKSIVNGPEDGWDHGRGINPDKEGIPTDCEVVTFESDCLIIYGTRPSNANANVVAEGLGGAIDDGTTEEYITNNRRELEYFFDSELLDAVLRGEATIKITGQGGDRVFSFVKGDGNFIKSYLFK
ncbi:MAG: hypothetical protein LBO06_02200 [Bacteroidales bacterium]|nr:hypothetical protein [Bacteroidales bacterium]